MLKAWAMGHVGQEAFVMHSISKHKNMIKDVVEIKHPFGIVSCSLDSDIYIWDIEGGIVYELERHHKKGVISIDYLPEFNGNIISVGFENYINVWMPEVSVVKSFIGKLEGHNSSVISAKFVQKTPYCVSIDHKLIIRVWDIRNFMCVQVLGIEAEKVLCNGLVMFGSRKKFALYGKRFIFFDTIGNKNILTSNVNPLHENYPIYADFNNYYHNITVITK